MLKTSRSDRRTHGGEVMRVVAMDGQSPFRIRTARSLAVAPGPHRLQLEGAYTVVTDFSYRKGVASGELLDASVGETTVPVTQAIVFTALAGESYRLSCDSKGRCSVTDDDGQVISSDGTGR